MTARSLVVEGLSVRLGGADVLSDVSFTVAPGARVGLIGESGSGKSMTALAIMGLLPSGAEATGSIRWGDRELIGMPERERARIRGAQIGMVFQEPQTALNPIRTVARQLAEPLRIHRVVARREIAGRVLSLAETVALPDPARLVRRYPHQLSGGQRQRVGIALALAAEPALLIADEPTTALDVTVQAGILRLLRRVVDDRDMGLVFVTHDLAVLAEVASHAIVLDRGRVVEHGALETMLRHPSHAVTQRLLAHAKKTLWRPSGGDER